MSEIVRVSSTTTGTNVTSVSSMPSHQAGDVLIGCAFRDGNNNAPTVPAGWTPIENGVGANSNGMCTAWKRATSGAETSGTWTSATSLNIHVYRNVSGIGGHAANGGSGLTVNYPALTMTDTSGRSWVVSFGGHRSSDTTIEGAPTGQTNVTDNQDSTDELAGHDTNAGVSSWGATDKVVTGTSSGWRTNVFELLPMPRSDLPKGTISVTGKQPKILVSESTSLPKGTIAVVGKAPTIRVSESTALPKGTISVVGKTPTIRVSESTALPKGTVAVTAHAPTIRVSESSALPSGTISITAHAPQFAVASERSQLPSGSIVVTGKAPTVRVSESTALPKGTISIVGRAPVISLGSFLSQLPAASILVAAHAPTIRVTESTALPSGGVHVAAFAPTVRVSESTALPKGTVAVAAHAPTTRVTESTALPSGSILVDANAPTIRVTESTALPKGSVHITAHAMQSHTGDDSEVSQLPRALVGGAAFAPSFQHTNVVQAPVSMAGGGGSVFLWSGPLKIVKHSVSVPSGHIRVRAFRPRVVNSNRKRFTSPTARFSLRRASPSIRVTARHYSRIGSELSLLKAARPAILVSDRFPMREDEFLCLLTLMQH